MHTPNEPSPGIVAVRDSKNPGNGTLIFGSEEWSAFVATVRITVSDS